MACCTAVLPVVSSGHVFFMQHSLPPSFSTVFVSHHFAPPNVHQAALPVAFFFFLSLLSLHLGPTLPPHCSTLLLSCVSSASFSAACLSVCRGSAAQHGQGSFPRLLLKPQCCHAQAGCPFHGPNRREFLEAVSALPPSCSLLASCMLVQCCLLCD